jgi:hypothetical protein
MITLGQFLDRAICVLAAETVQAFDNDTHNLP